MQNVDKLNPPIQYNIIWLIIGAGLVLAIGIWYGIVFWITRHKKVKSLDNLRQLPAGEELARLKAKYLKLIDEIYQRFQRSEIDLRGLHQALSKAVRDFVSEANHFPAPFLTLADLKLSPYPQLTKLIEEYYPEEFAVVTHGDAAASTQAAKGLVMQWPF